jgi:iron complex outermembrane receptor protein
VNFTRGVNALVNADANRSPANNSATWTKALPFATVNWQPVQSLVLLWPVCAGHVCARPVQLLHADHRHGQRGQQSTALASVKPQTSTNYQIGSVWHGKKVSVDIDGYIINVNNKIASTTDTTAISGALVNIGSVHYKGVEGQLPICPSRG